MSTTTRDTTSSTESENNLRFRPSDDGLRRIHDDARVYLMVAEGAETTYGGSVPRKQLKRQLRAEGYSNGEPSKIVADAVERGIFKDTTDGVALSFGGDV